ncbi:carbohydrate porin [Nostoc favosum]|uniref:Carbohydrate porin n=1 Tax=Nostoc favosum CHAB5714 TaxID=2780399 RepID=A0ABS8I2Z5_9NOSO|nr:carbohydrate porin [Nostoc favosum]MCC5598526.1 carbohydrate porin [Nostoc favosum CHAB5714]
MNGFIHAKAEDLPTDPNASIFTWAVLLALRDIGRKGRFAGFTVGQPPKVTHNTFGDDFKDKDTSLELIRKENLKDIQFIAGQDFQRINA